METGLRRLFVAALAAALFVAPGSALAQVPTKRISGANRYETMQRLAFETCSQNDYAVIATGNNFSDALSASALAGIFRCPILLTDGGSLSPEARDTLQYLAVSEAFIVGGTNSVSASVGQAISSMGIRVTRIYGQDRVGTSLAVQSFIKGKAPKEPSTYVFIATGSNFADALSIAPMAYSSGSAIVLAQGGKLTDAAVAQIRSDENIKDVLVGGSNAVSDQVKTQLGDGFAYERIEGADRYETSVAVADFEARHGFTWSRPCIATGQNFPDALAGSAAAGSASSPLLLVSPSSDSAAKAVSTHAGDISQLRVLGGEKSVPEALVAKTAGGDVSGPSSTEGTYVLKYDLNGLKIEGGSGDIGGVYVPGTIGEYKSRYGESGLTYSDQFLRGGIGGTTGSIPGANLTIQYLSWEDGDGSEAYGLYGRLGDLVDGVGSSYVSLEQLAKGLRAHTGSFDAAGRVPGADSGRAGIYKSGLCYVNADHFICYADSASGPVRELSFPERQDGAKVNADTYALVSTYAGVYQ